jgi:hypothetical protein
MIISMMTALLMLFLLNHIITSRTTTTHPSSNSVSPIHRFENSLNDIYITVHRQGTAFTYDLFWRKNPGLLRPHGQFSVAMYEKYGYYEGYSEGLPGSEEFNMSAVPYGCFFHIAYHLDIYINLGRWVGIVCTAVDYIIIA